MANDGLTLPQTPADVVAHARELDRLGRPAAARRWYERALHASAGSSPDPSPAALLRWIGATFRAGGDHSAAEDCYTASLASAHAHGSAEDVAHAENWLGVVAQERGQLDEAARHYTVAHASAERAGDRRTVALVLQNLAVLATMQGQPARALRHNQRYLALYEELQDHAAAAPLYNNLGLLLSELAHYERAAAAFDACAAACARAGDLHTRATMEVSRAQLFYLRGENDAALQACTRARFLSQQIGHRPVVGETYRWDGAIRRDLGDFRAAEAALEAAAAIARELDSPLLGAAVQREMGVLFHRQTRHHEALQSLHRAHAFYTGAHAAPLATDVDRLIHDLEVMFLEIVHQWSESIEQKDLYTSGHCARVADYACALARAVDFEPKHITWFRMGALLHDVGKIATPADILNKPGPLTDSERDVMERHTVIGEEMLGSMPFAWDIRPMIRYHHERWDGAGYPDRLSGAAIPLAARILGIADVFDALTSDRSYRPAFAPERALDIMQKDASAFDPDLLPVFLRLARRLNAA
ncbi:MAG: tetratricopeptide repeat protein [Gemmatimonadetes bacterium]|nr:tetratricopeptide repeat protein [Gemmatimonadota bacterium]